MPDTMNNFELKLPSDILENIPPSHEDMIRFLAKYFDGVIADYDGRFQKRVGGGPMGGPLSKYEKSILKDFLIDAVLGKQEEEPPMLAAVG
jgi:hypothetical protein